MGSSVAALRFDLELYLLRTFVEQKQWHLGGMRIKVSSDQGQSTPTLEVAGTDQQRAVVTEAAAAFCAGWRAARAA